MFEIQISPWLKDHKIHFLNNYNFKPLMGKIKLKPKLISGTLGYKTVKKRPYMQIILEKCAFP